MATAVRKHGWLKPKSLLGRYNREAALSAEDSDDVKNQEADVPPLENNY